MNEACVNKSTSKWGRGRWCPKSEKCTHKSNVCLISCLLRWLNLVYF